MKIDALGFWVMVSAPFVVQADIVNPMYEAAEWAAASIPIGTVVCFVLLSVCVSALVMRISRRRRDDGRERNDGEIKL